MKIVINKSITMRTIIRISAAVIVAAALIAAALLLRSNRRWQRELESYRQTVQTVLHADSLNRAKTVAIEAKAGSLELYSRKLAEEVQSLQISNRRLQYAAAIGSKVTVHTDQAVLHDTIVLVHTDTVVRIDTMRCLDWSDPWASIKACWHGTDTLAKVKLSVTDSLLLVVHRVPKFKLLGMKFGTKAHEVVVRHTCPHVTTESVLYIKNK